MTDRKACFPIYLVVSIVVVLLIMYYVYKGLEYSIREQILCELEKNEASAKELCPVTKPTLLPTPHDPITDDEEDAHLFALVNEAGFSDRHSNTRESQEQSRPEMNSGETGMVDHSEKGGKGMEYESIGVAVPSAPPFDENNNDSLDNYGNFNNWEGYNNPPPTYNEAVTNITENYGVYGSNDLEWHQVFDAFNEKRMAMALQWTPPPADGRPLKKCLEEVGEFLNAESHPVSAECIYRFLKAFVALANLVYAEMCARRRINVSDHSSININGEDETSSQSHCETFLKSFRLLMNEYVPKEPIIDRVVPFGYDWFIFSGRMTYALINAHVTLCSAVDHTSSGRPYYSEDTLVGTRAVVKGLKNICRNFAESLGYERYSSNRVYIGTAFLYACLLEKACDRLTVTEATPIHANGLMPDYKETLDGIITDPSNRYDAFKSLIDEIGRSQIPTTEDEKQKEKLNEGLPVEAQRGGVTYDGVYNDRSFFAHRRLRMYAYIHSYCEQLPSVQLLLREKQLDENKLSVLLRAVEPMSDEGSLFYFNLHSRAGGFKYRNGSALFAAFGLSKFRTDTTGTSHGRVYVADKARILFVQSRSFTFHSIGQLSDLAFGEVETSNRDLMPAWLMGQRPLFNSEKNKLVDVPCGSHLEPCVIDTGKSAGLKLDPIKRRNTTDYTPTEAASALVVFEEENIGAVFTTVREANMDVCYSRCTVATPYYTFTTYFRITRCNEDVRDEKHIRLSCYTGCSGRHIDPDKIESKQVEFKHCFVQLFVQTADGKCYNGTSVGVENKIGIERRKKSKSKYSNEELKNLSLSLRPYGHISSTGSPGSVTILYRPKSCKRYPLPKSYDGRKISPRVTIEETDVYRVQIDLRYVLVCDTKRKIVTLLDLIEKRACLAPIHSKLQDDLEELDSTDLIERSLPIVKTFALGTLTFDYTYNSRTYAYFREE